LSGPGSAIESENLKISTDNYIAVQQILLTRAGLAHAPADRSQNWLKFIDAGFHYVDERCNRFLAAIHKYDRAYKSKRDQIDALRIVTREILSEVSTAAKVINITASSFNLATKSLDNFRNSLILVLPSDVVIKTVKRERAAFKHALAQKSWTYLWSTRAMNAIAQYLNICVPANIEASIQNTLHLAEYDVTGDGDVVATAIKQSATRMGTTSALHLSPAQPTASRVDRPYSELPDDPGPAMAVGAKSKYEKTGLGIGDLKNIQSALCTTIDGRFGPQTRESIRSFEFYNRYQGIADPRNDGELTGEEYEAILALGPCPNSLYMGYLERFLFDLNGQPNKDFILLFQKSLRSTGATDQNGNRIVFEEDGLLKSLLNREKLSQVNEQLLDMKTPQINSRLYGLLVQSFGLPQ